MIGLNRSRGATATNDVIWRQKGKSDFVSTSSFGGDLGYRLDDMMFHIDTINSQGYIRVSIISETFPIGEELCHVDIPVLSIIENANEDISDSNQPYYSAYFPLLKPLASQLADGDIGNYAGKVPTAEYLSREEFECKEHSDEPYVHLLLRYTRDLLPDERKEKENKSSMRKIPEQVSLFFYLSLSFYSVLYFIVYYRFCFFSINISFLSLFSMFFTTQVTDGWCRLSVPAVSLSLVNSSRSVDVFSITVTDVDFCQVTTAKELNTTLTISCLQFDNQLKYSNNPVILCPTKVSYPKPFIVMHLSKDIELTHDRLVAFKKFGLTVQEIDLRIEQASFFELEDMLTDWISASKDNELQLDAEEWTAFDMLGFATCLETFNRVPILSKLVYYIVEIEINPIKVFLPSFFLLSLTLFLSFHLPYLLTAY